MAHRLRKFLSAPIAPLSLRNTHTAFHSTVVDGAASLVVDDEISANSVDRQGARAFLIDSHGSADPADIDATGAIVANRKVAGHIVCVNVARPVVNVNVAFHAPHDNVHGSISDTDLAV